ncbi:hypothetical protein L209DRAFT_370892 [Thermothelomyces heterothallicus CBS 203.75]
MLSRWLVPRHGSRSWRLFSLCYNIGQSQQEVLSSNLISQATGHTNLMNIQEQEGDKQARRSLVWAAGWPVVVVFLHRCYRALFLSFLSNADTQRSGNGRGRWCGFDGFCSAERAAVCTIKSLGLLTLSALHQDSKGTSVSDEGNKATGILNQGGLDSFESYQGKAVQASPLMA